MKTWLETVQLVKTKIAEQEPGYSQEKWINVTLDGKTFSVRTDCSGFVTACLKFMGILSASANATSRSFAAKKFQELENHGFKYIKFTSWESLKTGDIIALDGHVEIFAYNKDGKHYVFNAGSDSSINSKTVTASTHEKYTTVWRKTDAGKLIGDLKGFDYSDEKNESVEEKVKEDHIEPPKKETSKFPYQVYVKIKNLLIRKNAGTSYAAVTKNGKLQYTGVGTFTIVDEKTDKSGKKWGLLKSYQKGRNGWISLEYTNKK